VAVTAPSLIHQAQRLHEGLHSVREGGWIEYLEVFRDKPTLIRLAFTAALATTLTLSRAIGSRDSESAGTRRRQCSRGLQLQHRDRREPWQRGALFQATDAGRSANRWDPGVVSSSPVSKSVLRPERIIGQPP